MKLSRFNLGFTLLEVNLAIFVMSVSVLTVCGLYSMGFRENRQSVEDVAGVGLADAFLAPLAQGLSKTNLAWSAWTAIGDAPSRGEMESHDVADGLWPKDGWAAYVQDNSSTAEIRYKVVSGCNGVADQVFGNIKSKTGVSASKPSAGDYSYALVASRRGSVIQLSFRSAKRRQMLMAAPIYVSEVRFQGDPEK